MPVRVWCMNVPGGGGDEGSKGGVNFEDRHSRVMLGRCVGVAVVSYAGIGVSFCVSLLPCDSGTCDVRGVHNMVGVFVS